jgi:hypothetical protein
MTKLGKTKLFTATAPQKETMQDKTARIVREIQDLEREQRQVKNTHLRNARLESEAGTAVEPRKATFGRV